MLFASCSTYRTVRVEVLEPGRIKPGSGNSIGLICRNVDNKSDIKVGGNKIQRETAKSFAGALKEVFHANSSRFSSVMPMVEEEQLSLPKRQLPAPLSESQLEDICSLRKYDHIISIEMNDYTFIAKKKTEARWLIRFYSCGVKQPLDSVMYADTLTGNPAYINVLDYVSMMAWNKGVEYGSRITSSWVKTERRIYNKGRLLRMGDMFFMDDEIDEALKLWTAAWEKEPASMVRAGINLAWLNENAGDFENALNILKMTKEQATGMKINNDDIVYLNKYLKIIEKRIEDLKLLELP